MNLDDLPRAEFAFPGPLRDRLVTAILSGAKTATSGLVQAYERENEPLPKVGQLLAVVDSADRRVAAIELTEVRVIRLADVNLRHALDEGEGDESVAQWRAGHEKFWHSAEVRAELGDPHFTVNDDTLVLAQRFRLVPVDERDCLGGRERPCPDLPLPRSAGMCRYPRVTASIPDWLPHRARNGHAVGWVYLALRLDQDTPQRCCAAWRLMPSREPISPQE